jgi:CHAD domain-containing protein
LRQRLQIERRRRQQRVAAKLDRFDVRRLQTRVERLRQPVAVSPEGRLPGTAVLLLRLTKRVEELEEAVHAAGPLYAPEPIHAVRIAVKKLRYAFELARDLRLLGSSRVLTTLRAAQQTLGRLHDLQVLVARFDALRAEAAASGPQVEALNAVSSQLEEECRQLHARFVARREKLVAAVDEALANVADRAATVADQADVTVH